MSKILVSGLINFEATLKIDRFPLDYFPVRYAFQCLQSSVSGVGFNIAKALKILGNDVSFHSIIGADAIGDLVIRELTDLGISTVPLVRQIPKTAHSVILYDSQGKRQIHVDLKEIQETTYPVSTFQQALPGCSMAVLCNINFSRPFLKIAKGKGIPIATDVHAISDIKDSYNREFMEHAAILFMSHELLPCPPEEWLKNVQSEFSTPIVVIGLGAEGALLGVKKESSVERIPAVVSRPIVNTIGAGDALFSSFNHYFIQTGNPHLAIRKAVTFASYKIGEAGAAQGLLTEAQLDLLFSTTPGLSKP